MTFNNVMLASTSFSDGIKKSFAKLFVFLKLLAKTFREKNILGIRQNSLKVLAKSFRRSQHFAKLFLKSLK